MRNNSIKYLSLSDSNFQGIKPRSIAQAFKLSLLPPYVSFKGGGGVGINLKMVLKGLEQLCNN